MTKTAWLSKELTNGKILCQACAHACKLGEGQYGICDVRKVKNGELKLLVYGLVAAANIDPIEKKPLFHVLPQSSVLSIGTVGCNFKCSFCQNHTISQYPQEHNHNIFGDEYSPEFIVKSALENNCKSIAYTYNEPIIFFEYTYDIAELAHKNGLKNIYVTSGYETKKAIDLLAPYIDAMNIDIKSFNDKFYQELCCAKLKPVLECVKYAYSKGIWCEITTLLIPTKNDSDEEIREIAQFIYDISPTIPWHISAFHPTYKLTDINRTPISTLHRAYKIGLDVGLKYVYVGNIDDEDCESTYCPKCKEKVINRCGNIGQHVMNKLGKNGTCKNCGYKIDGIWN